MTGVAKALGLALALFIAFILLAVFGASPAAAQGMQNCAPREMVLERLTSKYGESLQMVALAANGAVVEVMASGGGRDLDHTCHATYRANLSGRLGDGFRSGGIAVSASGR